MTIPERPSAERVDEIRQALADTSRHHPIAGQTYTHDIGDLLAEVGARGREIDDLNHEVMAHQVSDGYNAGFNHGTLATLDRVARDMGLDRRSKDEDSADWGRRVLAHVARLAEASAIPHTHAADADGDPGGCSPHGRRSGSTVAP